MKFSEYTDAHHAFTTAGLMAVMDSAPAAEEQLRLAVRSGAVERVRRGLLVSNRGRFKGVAVDSAEVVSALDSAAVLSYHSALEAHGVAHNIGFVCRFRSDFVISGFSFRGVDYRPCGPVGRVKSKALRIASGRCRATTREQTVIDCLAKPSLAGGAEEAVRSLTAFAYLDVDELVEMAVEGGPSMAARVGWLLTEKAEDWHVDDGALAELRGMVASGPYRLGRAAREPGWSSDWKLVLPERNEEVESWITRF